MDSITELAKLFKERNNPTLQGISVGKVLSPPPNLKITVNGFIFDKSDLVVANHLLTTYDTSSAQVGDHGEHLHTVEELLHSGDKIIVIPSINNAIYFIIDKVGDI
ncbi:DUF2577 family protein [Clostridium aminobutyricum]|uniref:DUF2577 domain-containing protein n=1 Tax=Clostridium aminobutyricum TaxID=33953 RepID=A0A939D839_CLOAM|nr:DUF2577 family protein [Clostridium aminobutyricum]MBN7773164.1 DUF2577 domain-containing protein [Clostridium aminobutyricum]